VIRKCISELYLKINMDNSEINKAKRICVGKWQVVFPAARNVFGSWKSLERYASEVGIFY